MKEGSGEVLEDGPPTPPPDSIDAENAGIETSAMRPLAAAPGVSMMQSNNNNEKVEMDKKTVATSAPGRLSSRKGSGASDNSVSVGSRNGVKRSSAEVQDKSKSPIPCPLIKRTKTLPVPGKRQRDIRTFFTKVKVDEEEGPSGKKNAKPAPKLDEEKPGCSKVLLRETPPPEEETSTTTDGTDSSDSDQPGDESDEYEVEKITDYWDDDKKGKQYLVRWKGWSKDHDTWEPAENVKNCYQLLVNFYHVRVKEIEKTRVKYGDDPVLLESTLNQLPLPADPRPIREQMKVFFDRKGAMTEEEVEITFKKMRKSSKLRWTDARIQRSLKDFRDGKLADDQTESLRFQLVYAEANLRYETAQAELKAWEGHLNGIANGKPTIKVVNEVDFAGPPVHFEYINRYVAGEGVVINEEGLVACDCKGGDCLGSKDCCPTIMGTPEDKIAYTKNKRLRVEQGTPIYECNRLCPCPPECSNRVVQDGTINLTTMQLSIFRTDYNCGWGVKTLKPIKKGTFVALYAGEVIFSDEAENRGKEYDRSGNTYLFDLDFHDQKDCLYSVDAARMGNISHFINHSCEPNLAVFNVWVNSVDVNIPMLTLFSTRFIPANEELSFDYGMKRQGEDSASQENKKRGAGRQLAHGSVKCRCGTQSCRKILF